MSSGKRVLSWERRRVILEAFNVYASNAIRSDEHSVAVTKRAWDIVGKHLIQAEKDKLSLYTGADIKPYKEICKQIREDMAERLLHGE